MRYNINHLCEYKFYILYISGRWVFVVVAVLKNWKLKLLCIIT